MARCSAARHDSVTRVRTHEAPVRRRRDLQAELNEFLTRELAEDWVLRSGGASDSTRTEIIILATNRTSWVRKSARHSRDQRADQLMVQEGALRLHLSWNSQRV
ncbi:unnamed protein product, partial [Pleuronectes platessa]